MPGIAQRLGFKVRASYSSNNIMAAKFSTRIQIVAVLNFETKPLKPDRFEN